VKFPLKVYEHLAAALAGNSSLEVLSLAGSCCGDAALAVSLHMVEARTCCVAAAPAVAAAAAAAVSLCCVQAVWSAWLATAVGTLRSR
jgi:hypothetical protein